MTRFIKWDYTKNEATEYKRTGVCNGCGDCCRARIEYSTAGRRTNKIGAGRMGDTTDQEGVWSECMSGRMRRFIKILSVGEIGESDTCSMLKNGLCSINETKSLAIGKQGALCLAWPIIPEHVVLFSKCSYKFEEISHWEFSALLKKTVL